MPRTSPVSSRSVSARPAPSGPASARQAYSDLLSSFFDTVRQHATKLARQSPRESERGFTLVELMVVVVIIGMLATVVVVNVLPSQDVARVEVARSDIARLSSALELYNLHTGEFPTTDQGLEALRTAPSGLARPQRYQRGGYINNLPDDPWGSPYQYVFPGENGGAFDLFSMGADRQRGGEGLDQDIGNWSY